MNSPKARFERIEFAGALQREVIGPGASPEHKNACCTFVKTKKFLSIAEHYHLRNAGQDTVVVMCVRVNR